MLPYCGNQFLNWLLQYTASILHLFFKSLFFFPPNKKPHPNGWSWWRRRDLLPYCGNQFLNWLLQYTASILHLFFKSLFFFPPNKKPHPNGWGLIWRRRRDLNPRYPFGVYTISNRARSASYATSPCAFSSCRLAYNTPCNTVCQA